MDHEDGVAVVGAGQAPGPSAVVYDVCARNRLLAEHVGMIRAFVRRKVREADVEDVAHDVVLAALASFPTFHGSGAFGAWLRTIARRTVADYYRDIEPSVDLSRVDNVEPIISQDRGGPDSIEATEDRLDAEMALTHVSSVDRIVLDLRFAKGLPFAEVSRRVGVSEAAVKMRVKRVKLKIVADEGDRCYFSDSNWD